MDNIDQILNLKSDESYKIYKNNGSLIHLLHAANLGNELASKQMHLFNDYFTHEYLCYLIITSHKSYKYSLNNLGYIYKHGLGIEQNYNIAKEYFIKSDTPTSLNNLGHMYCYGLGVKQDYNKARECYIKSCSVSALNNLGYMYCRGWGVKQDYDKAIEYFIKSGTSQSFNNLGHMYFHGLGVTQDYDKAMEYYTKSDSLDNLILV